MKKHILLILTAAAGLLCSCSALNHAAMDRGKADMLKVQSDFSIRYPSTVHEISQPVAMVPQTAITNEVTSTELAVRGTADHLRPVGSMPAVTRKAIRAELKQLTREQKKEIRQAALYSCTGRQIAEPASVQRDSAPFIDRVAAAIIAFFIPPLGAGLYFGKDKRTWITLGLTLLFWLPGMIYAMIMILRD